MLILNYKQLSIQIDIGPGVQKDSVSHLSETTWFHCRIEVETIMIKCPHYKEIVISISMVQLWLM